MANNCDFSMRITGGEAEIKELISMLRWEGKFKDAGLGRTYSFDVDDDVLPTELAGVYQVDGFGDCAWSVLTAMCEEYRKDAPSLESETKRLGLVVEVYSSEPGCCFQEHYLFVKGDVVKDECVDYNEYWIEGMSDEDIAELCEEKGISKEDLMKAVNDNGDYCIGGFGDDYGVFEDVSEYFTQEHEKDAEKKQPLGEVIKSCEEMSKKQDNLKIQPELVQMPGTEGNWGEKHWGSER